jgi:protein-S-isoprenylcysteine O-methyltransferase Ste14
MYGEKAPSLPQKTFLVVNHLIALAGMAWLLFGGDLEQIGARWGWSAGDLTRRVLLMGCALVYFTRLLFTAFLFMKRKMAWSEALTIAFWIYLIYTVFATTGGTNRRPIDLVTILGLALFVLGSYLNTGSEYMRHVWKRQPENAGKLYTGGLFRYARHINYFGDITLFTGFALVAGRLPALIIPALMIVFFATFNVPALDKYLAGRYGQAFDDYARKTKRLIPFVY